MEKFVKWSQWSDIGLMNFGQMSMKDINKTLREFNVEAIKVLKETGADHILYGIKFYDKSGEHLEEVKFYMLPLSDEEFDRKFNISMNMIVYAVHRR